MTATPAELARALDDALLRDRPRLRARLRGLRRRAAPEQLAALAEAIAASRARVAARRARLPRPEFPAELPISAQLDELGRLLQAHPVVVVAGATGSGKTTQLPKLCLALGRGVHGQVGHTQPRRLAARSVAARIAEELGSPLGELVGYRVRFQERGHPDALVRLMTDGILLNELQQDRLLLRYDTLIIDEAHERSLNIDFLLGYLKGLLPRRPELKLIITSATIDTARFAAHFGGAPVLEIPGRSWPVEVRYRPLEGAEDDRDLPAAVVDAVAELADADGDVLVFLPGEREIRDTAEALRKHHPKGTELLPLYARLGAAEQQRVFHPGDARRVVLATNVAETSLTVPGIRHVVDSGLARISRYAGQGHVQRLPVEPVARASADQRRGRCGRLGPGICIRLYAEEEYLARPEYGDPEIRRTPLAAVILQMEAHGLGRIDRFPFLDPPDPRRVRDGWRQLVELGAIDREHRLTGLGRRLARLPLDPRLGRMLLAAADTGCLAETLVIVAALAVQDPRERPHDASAAADAAHAEFADPRSDFLGYLKLWHAWQAQRRQLSQNQLRKWCRARFLGCMRLREWQETHQQLDHLLRDMGLHPNPQPAPPDAIHRALLAGLLGQVARREEKTGYRGLRERVLQLFPGSALVDQPPPWIVAAELVETRRLYARTAAPVRPQWIEAAAGPLVRREYLDPRWVRRRGQVIAYERVTFQGLLLVARRRVNYGPLDPLSAREIFLRAALVDGELDTRGRFLHHNRTLVAEIEALEAKTRRRDLLAGEETVYRFYAERLPPTVFDRSTFEAWRQRAERRAPRLLYMERALLLSEEPPADTPRLYPDRLALPRLQLPLHYRFAPEAADDGVTARLPLAALDQVSPARLDWLVPGLLQEKVVALLRALPKALRRECVPVPETATACVAAMSPGDTPLAEALAAALRRLRGLVVPAGSWDLVELPRHLRLHLQVVDADGAVVAAGDDLAALQAGLAGAAAASRAAQLPWGEADGLLTGWSCGPLPARLQLRQAGVAVNAWPALVDRGDGVAVELLGDAAAARRAHRRGLGRLFRLQLGRETRALRRQLPGLQPLALWFATLGDPATLLDDLLAASVERLCVDDAVRDAEAFAARLEVGRAGLVATATELAGRAGEVLRAYHAVASRLAEAPAAWAEPVAELREQLAALVYPGFVSATPEPWLGHLPRYLRAAGLRLDRLADGLGRDRARAAELAPWWVRWRGRAGAEQEQPELARFRWMLEEFRVALFAQELRTALPVSAPRLQRQWERVLAAERAGAAAAAGAASG